MPIIQSGVPIAPDLFDDGAEKVLVKLIQDVERLAAGVPA